MKRTSNWASGDALSAGVLEAFRKKDIGKDSLTVEQAKEAARAKKVAIILGLSAAFLVVASTVWVGIRHNQNSTNQAAPRPESQKDYPAPIAR